MEIKECPICGAVPQIKTYSLDRGNGHGYPGNFSTVISCPKCGCPKEQAADDIYSDNMVERAIEKWNAEVDRITKLMKK